MNRRFPRHFMTAAGLEADPNSYKHIVVSGVGALSLNNIKAKTVPIGIVLVPNRHEIAIDLISQCKAEIIGVFRLTQSTGCRFTNTLRRIGKTAIHEYFILVESVRQNHSTGDKRNVNPIKKRSFCIRTDFNRALANGGDWKEPICKNLRRQFYGARKSLIIVGAGSTYDAGS